MMKCTNRNCGTDALEGNKLCYNCNEIATIVSLQSKLKTEHQHGTNDWRRCKECCGLNIRSRSIVCNNCGDNRQYEHRLCSYCINDTSPCEFCNSRRTIEAYIRSCVECMSKNTYCAYTDCSAQQVPGSIVCQEHCCKNNGCLNAILDKYNNKDYCDKCVCACCKKLKINDKYCLDHTCRYDNCHNYGNKFCDEHMCKAYDCSNGIVHNGEYCLNHTCSIENCVNRIKSNYTYTRPSYCNNHSCDTSTCSERKYMNRPLCVSHLCTVDGCDQSSYGYLCHNHSIIDTRCRNKHLRGDNYRNCSMMKISKLIKSEHKLDKKILWRQLYNSNNNFYVGFLKLGYSLLSVLRQNSVCKDVRQIIFYEYLLSTIKYYFDRECYNCVMICKKEKCGKVGLPYDSGCKMHVCSMPKCGKLRYKELKICIDHKCKHCTKVTCNDKQFCRRHLCPLCNTNCIADGYNYCRMCRCKQRINNGYGSIRCENPVCNEMGDRRCLEHKKLSEIFKL